MWRCLKDAADRGGLSRVGGTRSTDARQWFASVVGRALEGTLVTPSDVLRFLPPSEYAGAAPRSVMAELLKEALATSRFDPDLVLQHLTPTVIAENLETSLVWDCITDAVVRNFELGAAAAPKINSATNGASGVAKAGVAAVPAPAAAAATPAPAAPAAISIKPPAKDKIEERAPPRARSPHPLRRRRPRATWTTTGPRPPTIVASRFPADSPVFSGAGPVRTALSPRR
jgi:hypothetical protein